MKSTLHGLHSAINNTQVYSGKLPASPKIFRLKSWFLAENKTFENSVFDRKYSVDN
jgi:hypothetical protein